MDIKKLNETLRHALNELSPETKQSLLDKRAERFKDAQAKLNRARDLVDSSNERIVVKPNAIEEIKNGTYSGKDIDKIVLTNIDEFSVEDLIKILDNTKWWKQGYTGKLFPSYYHNNTYRSTEFPGGVYPAKLAEALAKFKDAECLGDLFNIFYNHQEYRVAWREAKNIWSQYATSPKEIQQTMDAGEEWFNELTELLYKNLPKVAAKIERECLKVDPEKVSQWIENRDK